MGRSRDAHPRRSSALAKREIPQRPNDELSYDRASRVARSIAADIALAVPSCGRPAFLGSAEWRTVEDLDVHDHVVDHVKDQVTRLGRAQADVSVAGAVCPGRLWGGEEALAEIVVAAALLEQVEGVDPVRQVVLAFLAERGHQLSREVWPLGAHQRWFVGHHRQRR
jgi:hypothetical protein